MNMAAPANTAPIMAAGAITAALIIAAGAAHGAQDGAGDRAITSAPIPDAARGGLPAYVPVPGLEDPAMVPVDRGGPMADREVGLAMYLVAEDPEAVRDREGRAAEEWAVATMGVARAVVDPVGAAEPHHICSWKPEAVLRLRDQTVLRPARSRAAISAMTSPFSIFWAMSAKGAPASRAAAVALQCSPA